MSQQNQLNDIGKLKEILVFYLRRWKIFLVSLIVCISIAILYIYNQTCLFGNSKHPCGRKRK